MKSLITLLLTILSFHFSVAQSNQKQKRFIDSLMQQMTLEEKIGQLNLSVIANGAVTGTEMSKDVKTKIQEGKMGGVFGIWDVQEIKKLQALAVKKSRLHIPLLFGLDVIHGHKTIFPVPLALSATWDTALIKKVARVSAIEASADGINWVFSPMVDITRDARWGRVVEGSGEDPFLGAQIAKVMVEGYQGNNLAKNNTVMACVKHFALYGAPVAGRAYNSVDMSLQQMYQYYLSPYKAALDAGAGSIMTSFNDINGLPATANKWLLTNLLRKQWHYNGLVVSDYSSVNELMAHGLGTQQQIAALAINAGTNMEMVGEAYLKTLKKSVKEGKVSVHTIDDACRKVLVAKYKLGLFTDPYRYINTQRAETEEFTLAHRQLAKEAAAKSFVLLKNNNQTLPLRAQGTIAVIGPLADSKINMQGAWNIAGNPEQCITVLAGIKNYIGHKANIVYQKGANITDDPLLKARVNSFKKEIITDTRSPKQMIADALQVAKKADIIIAVVGEAADMSGEAASRTHISIPLSQQKLLRALKQTGKPLVLVLFNGRPLTLNWANEHCDAILDVWFGGSETGNAVAEVLLGKYNPSGKLTMTFPLNAGQIPIYYNHKNTGRPFDKNKDNAKFKSDYLDAPNEPLFPFGYGLSYTKFTYGKVKLSQQRLKGNQKLTASIRLSNTGKYAGTEIVQLYITDLVARVTRSVQDLKGFKKITLQPGASKTVSFTITPEDLKYYNYNLKYDWDAGNFIIKIGSNAKDTKSATIYWEK